MKTRRLNPHKNAKDVLRPDEFNPKNVKIRITTFVDEDVLTSLKKIAKSRGSGYQTVLNELLRRGLEDEGAIEVTALSEKSIRRIFREEVARLASKRVA